MGTMILHMGVELAFNPTERRCDDRMVGVVLFLGTLDQCDEDGEAARDEGNGDRGHVTREQLESGRQDYRREPR